MCGSRRLLGFIALALAGMLRAGEPETCVRCHVDDMRGGHTLLVRPVQARVPLSWPLDAGGRVTCLTCHTGCGASDTQGPRGSGLLRGQELALDFCANCHGAAPNVPLASPRGSGALPGNRTDHSRWIAVAHPAARARRTDQEVDAVSRMCFACHDDTLAALAEVRCGQGLRRGRAGNLHPIGVPYPRDSSPNGESAYKPYETLLPRMVLPHGRLACLSCHDLFAREEHLLVMSNYESRLCTSCHDL